MVDELKQQDKLLIHQALHGYDEGHRLLSCSTKLHSKDEKIMLILSDSSGSGSINVSSGYLTGYPLQESGYYALARTWPAPEMTRPGCVWTHTLLIEFADLATFQSLQSLMPLFHRPSVNEAFESYSKQLQMLNEDIISYPEFEIQLLRLSIKALYEKPSERIVLFKGEQYTREAIIFSIWDQQWPRLRRSFRFCSLALNDRSLEGFPFDLQFAPVNEPAAKTRFKSAIDAENLKIEDNQWLEDTIDDIKESKNRELRAFLKQVGSDILQGRSAFISLCKLYKLIKSSKKNPQTIDNIISSFEADSNLHNAKIVRLLIFSMAVQYIETIGNEGLSFLVNNLNTVKENDLNELAIRIGRVLWKRDPALMTSYFQEEIPKRLIAEAINTLTIQELIAGIAKSSDILPSIVQKRPEIITDSAYWKLNNSLQFATFNVIWEHQIDRQSVITAMLESGIADLAYEAIKIFGTVEVLTTLLKRQEPKDSERLDDIELGWWKISCLEANALAKVLGNRPTKSIPALARIARFTYPEFVPNEYGNDPWWTAIEGINSKNFSEPYKYLSVYLLTRVLMRRSRNQAELIAWAFDNVYFAALYSQLSNYELGMIERYLPRSFLIDNWDICQKLRIAVAEIFVSEKLPFTYFKKITENKAVFLELVQIMEKSGKKGRRYLEQVKRISQ